MLAENGLCLAARWGSSARAGCAGAGMSSRVSRHETRNERGEDDFVIMVLLASLRADQIPVRAELRQLYADGDSRAVFIWFEKVLGA